MAFGSLTLTSTATGWSGVGNSGVNFTSEITGSGSAEKFALTRPGVPVGLRRSFESGDEVQLNGSSLLAPGQMRSNDPDAPAAPSGHGVVLAYFTASTIFPRALESSSFSPWLLRF